MRSQTKARNCQNCTSHSEYVEDTSRSITENFQCLFQLIYHLFIRFSLSLNLNTLIIIYGEAPEKAKGGEGKVGVTL